MIALLNVNVLVALFDPSHVYFDAAHAWFGGHREEGWATCPLTENALVRIVSSPTYPGRRTTLDDALDRLAAFRAAGDHHFWSDSISICDPDRLRPRHVQGHRQLADVYLLALAVHHDGCLVTFDATIDPEAVAGATSEHLTLIGT